MLKDCSEIIFFAQFLFHLRAGGVPKNTGGGLCSVLVTNVICTIVPFVTVKSMQQTLHALSLQIVATV